MSLEALAGAAVLKTDQRVLEETMRMVRARVSKPNALLPFLKGETTPADRQGFEPFEYTERS